MTTKQPLPLPVQQLIKAKRFIPTKVNDNKRHFLLIGKMPAYNYLVVIKMGRSRTTLRQRNHVLWTKYMHKAIPSDAKFHIAEVLESGYTETGWHWLIMPYIQGEQFARLDSQHVSTVAIADPEKVLPRIVELMRFIEKTPAHSVAGLDARWGGIARSDKLKLLESAIDNARDSIPHVVELLQIISKNFTYLRTSNSHGDFSDINLIINEKSEPVLIDAEIGNAFNYKYYDCIEFYNRLYTRACNPELAKAFLKAYVAKVPKANRQKFFSNLLCLSAVRCIENFSGELASMHEDGAVIHKRLVYAKRYAETIVSYDVIDL